MSALFVFFISSWTSSCAICFILGRFLIESSDKRFSSSIFSLFIIRFKANLNSKQCTTWWRILNRIWFINISNITNIITLFLSFYFKKECKRSNGRNEIESNIRITFSSVYFFNSSTNIESSALNLSTSILSVSHNRSMNKYFLLNISDSKHCILFSVRSCLVIGSLFVSISNWFNKSTSFL